MSMSDKEAEELGKTMEQPSAENSLRAVFAACVATEMRAGKSQEEATRICHARIGKQLEGGVRAQPQTKDTVPSKGSGMRITAGIFLIILGLLSFMPPMVVANMVAWARSSSIEEFGSIRLAINPQASLVATLLIVFVVGGGIGALRRKAYRWALSAGIVSIVAGLSLLFLGRVEDALVSVIYIPLALMAVIFLVKRKEQFQGRVAPG